MRPTGNTVDVPRQGTAGNSGQDKPDVSQAVTSSPAMSPCESLLESSQTFHANATTKAATANTAISSALVPSIHAKTVASGGQHLPSSVMPVEVPVWVILGPPGSGKGTYASLLAPRFGLDHLAVGDLVRDAVKRPEHAALKKLVDMGQLLPDKAVIALLLERLTSVPTGTSAVLLDGFPRTLKQAQLLKKFCRIKLVLNVVLKDEHIVAKIEGRRVCKVCRRGYNFADVCDPVDGVYMPPILPNNASVASNVVDDIGRTRGVMQPLFAQAKCSNQTGGNNAQLSCDCGGTLVRRSDDDPKVAAYRLCQHHKEAGPILNFFEHIGVLMNYKVSHGVGDMEELAARIQTKLDLDCTRVDYTIASSL